LVKRGVALGLEELSPNKTVQELFRGYRPGHRVSVLGRYQSHAQPYIEKMRDAGLDARFVATENGEQSFCYLMSATEDVIGVTTSTFAIWSTYLGNASNVLLYSVRSQARMERFVDGYFFHYNYTNPALKKKISFGLYNSEAQDLLDDNNKERSERQLLKRRESQSDHPRDVRSLLRKQR
jgi:hypothetical protein